MTGSDATDTTVYLTEEPSEEYVQYLRETSEIKAIIWPEGCVALP